MPIINLNEQKKRNSSPWKSIAKSILSPYIPKNKLILKELLKSHENLRKIEDFSKKNMTISYKNLRILPVKAKQLPNIQKKKKRTLSCPSEENEPIYDNLNTKNTNPLNFSIRRRSYICNPCGKNNKFQEKINALLPNSFIKHHFIEKKRKISIQITDAKNKQKYSKKFINSATLKHPNNLNLGHKIKSVLLKNNLDNGLNNNPSKRSRQSLNDDNYENFSTPSKNSIQFPNQNTTNLSIKKEEDSIVLGNEKINPIYEKFKKKCPQKNFSPNSTNNLLTWRFKPNFFLDRLLQKIEINSKKNMEFYKNSIGEKFFKTKQKSFSANLQKKDLFAKSAYDTKTQLNFLKKTLNLKKLAVNSSLEGGVNQRKNSSSQKFLIRKDKEKKYIF